jgi:hypothetical protein
LKDDFIGELGEDELISSLVTEVELENGDDDAERHDFVADK